MDFQSLNKPCTLSAGWLIILECKYRCFVSITILYIIIATILYIIFVLRRDNIFRKKKLSIIQYFAMIFLILNIVSCLISPYFKDYNLFIGAGRGEGLITSVLYILSFLYVSYFGKFQKKYILYFSISSIFISFVAILQFVGFKSGILYGIHDL